MTKYLEILDSPANLIERALQVVISSIETAIAQRGVCRIVLAGGNTPRPLYEQLAQKPLPWEKLYFFWGDERYVPGDHPDSNQRMARQAWLNQVPIPSHQIYPMPTSAKNPVQDAINYEATLRNHFDTEEIWPRFDVVLLGMGDDGHMASLFPRTKALEVGDRLVTVGDKQGEPRLTMTIPLLNSAHTVMFLVAGANKQVTLECIFQDNSTGRDYPSKLIDPNHGDLWWLLDAAAGDRLAKDPPPKQDHSD